MSSQIVFRAVESLSTARFALGSHVAATFLRWRLEDDVLFLGMGIGNLKGTKLTCIQLNSRAVMTAGYNPLDRMLPSAWYKDGEYPVIERNSPKNSLIAHHWGGQIIVNLTRAMLRGW